MVQPQSYMQEKFVLTPMRAGVTKAGSSSLTFPETKELKTFDACLLQDSGCITIFYIMNKFHNILLMQQLFFFFPWIFRNAFAKIVFLPLFYSIHLVGDLLSNRNNKKNNNFKNTLSCQTALIRQVANTFSISRVPYVMVLVGLKGK